MSDRVHELEYAVRCWKRLALTLAAVLAFLLLGGVALLVLSVQQQRAARAQAEQARRAEAAARVAAEQNFQAANQAVAKMLDDVKERVPVDAPQP